MDNRTFDEQYEKARRAAEAADAIEPRADTAYYDRASHLIVIRLRNGESFSFSPTVLEELAHGSPDELRQIEVSPSGDGLSWPALDVDLGLVLLMHITSGPAATAATIATSDAPGLLEQLYAQLEMAWTQRRAVPLVDQLAARYPEYKDELYDFFELLVDSELGEPLSKEEVLQSVERTREWLAEKDCELAVQVVEDMKPHDATADPTAPQDNIGSVAVGSVSPDCNSTSDHEGTLPLGFMGLLQLRTNQSPLQLQGEMGVPDFILTFAQDNPPEETPEGTRKEIVRRAKAKGWIQEGEGEKELNRVGTRAALRRTPYAHSMQEGAESTSRSKFSRYVELIYKSRLKRAEKKYWLAFSERNKDEEI